MLEGQTRIPMQSNVLGNRFSFLGNGVNGIKIVWIEGVFMKIVEGGYKQIKIFHFPTIPDNFKWNNPTNYLNSKDVIFKFTFVSFQPSCMQSTQLKTRTW